MKGEERKYQKCFDKVVLDRLASDYPSDLPSSVAVYFSWNKPVTSFRWKPKFVEVKDIILALTDLLGKEEVEKELNIKIGGETNGRV